MNEIDKSAIVALCNGMYNKWTEDEKKALDAALVEVLALNNEPKPMEEWDASRALRFADEHRDALIQSSVEVGAALIQEQAEQQARRARQFLEQNEQKIIDHAGEVFEPEPK